MNTENIMLHEQYSMGMRNKIWNGNEDKKGRKKDMLDRHQWSLIETQSIVDVSSNYPQNQSNYPRIPSAIHNQLSKLRAFQSSALLMMWSRSHALPNLIKLFLPLNNSLRFLEWIRIHRLTIDD